MNKRIVLTSVMGTAFLVLLAGCGIGGGEAVNVFTVYDDRTISCEQAKTLSTGSNDSERIDESIRRAARSKLSWCEAISGGPIVLVGYFDNSEKVYDFKGQVIADHVDISRFCLELAAANFVFDVPPKNLLFTVQTTLDGDVETFPCERLPLEMNRRALTVLIAPTHIPLLMDIDPVLVLATGANPRLEGVPHRYYDEVRDTLERILSDLGSL